MNPGVIDLDIYRGDTKRWKFKLWQDTAKTLPVDLAGATVNATIRDKATNGSYELPLACTVTEPNIVDMVLTAGQSRNLPSVGVWDLQVTFPSGDIASVLKGAVVVTQDVTYVDA
jgi:hypothetical protein